MTLSDISIKNPVFAWMLMLGLMLFGAISFGRMGVSQMPDVDFPMVNITAEYEGASPDIIETDVIDIIEDQLMGVEGIVEVTSTAQHSMASITVELDIDQDVDAAIQEINTKISQARRFLPFDMEPPVIAKRNPEDFPVMWVSLYTERPLRELMDYARYHVKDRFQTIPGVAEVRLAGYVDRNVRIWVDRDRLFGYELSVDDIIATLGREHVEIPGGLIETQDKEIIIRSMGEAETVRLLSDLPLSARGGLPVYRRIVLGDVNPGAQIVAAGDIVVMGTLRGMVHAGATGDHTACAAAFRLAPTQLRIASYLARPPEEPGGHPEYPEVALVRDGVVIVRPLHSGTFPGLGPTAFRAGRP